MRPRSITNALTIDVEDYFQVSAMAPYIARSGTSRVELSHRIDAEDNYYREINDRWSNALRAAAAAIPLPDYASEPIEQSMID